MWKSVRVELEDDVGGGNNNTCVSERRGDSTCADQHVFEITHVGVGEMQTSAIFAYLNVGNCSYCILFIEDLLDVSATATATTAAAAATASRVLLFNDALASTSSSSSTC